MDEPTGAGAAGAAGGPAARGWHRRDRPRHERAPLNAREERALRRLETGLPSARSTRTRLGDRAPHVLFVVLVLVLTAVLSVGETGAAAFGVLALLVGAAALAWDRDGGRAAGSRERRA